MNKRAYETINKVDEAIKGNEERILELNKYIKLAKANYDIQTIVSLEDIKRQYKALNRRLRQSKKALMKTMTNYAEEIDKNTKDTVSNIPLTREYLQANYRVCDSFNTVTLNSINADLPVRLSDHALNKLINECFPEVESRRITGYIKYNLEMIL